MSLTVGIVALALIAGGCLISKAWDEHCWRRDERDAERRLALMILRQRAELLGDLESAWELPCAANPRRLA